MKNRQKTKPSKFYTSIQLFFWSSGNKNVIWPLKCVPRRFMFQAIWKKKISYFTDLKEKILWLCFGGYVNDWKGHFLSHVSSVTLGGQWERGGEIVRGVTTGGISFLPSRSYSRTCRKAVLKLMARKTCSLPLTVLCPGFLSITDDSGQISICNMGGGGRGRFCAFYDI